MQDDNSAFGQIIFDKKSFGDVLRDVYYNHDKRNKQINELIDTLKLTIRSSSDAALLTPFIKDYLDIAVKNDDNVVKLSSIIQRTLVKSNTSSDDFGSLFNEKEMKELTSNMSSNDKSDLIGVVDTHTKINKKIKKLSAVHDSAADLIAELELDK
jgi:hypothetical protein